jgi:hypothetical protein
MMGELYADMGFIRYPLTFSLVVVLALAGWSTSRLFSSSAWASLRTKAWVDAILFWGAFAVISGVLGTLIGVIVAAQSIEAAGQVQTTLVWGGIKIAMLSSVFGVLILALSALLWFGLQMRWRLLAAGEAVAAEAAA